MIVAKHLLAHPEVAAVHYPGLPTHAGHETAKGQMSDFGGMISFELKGDLERAKRMISSCGIFALAESLGGVESLIGHPASMTHGSIPREERLKAGLTDGLIRLSVGIEDAADLTADLDRALVRSLRS
jgi:cystathionine beta-lyase/cystathionine gamma-synthase